VLVLFKKPGVIIKPAITYLLIVISMLLGACDRDATQDRSTDGAEITLNVWAHAGQAAERKVLQAQVRQFNKQNPNITLKLTFIPERDYNAQVQAAALAGDLPDVLELDGPFLYNYIWQNHLLPLEEHLPRELMDDLLPSIIDQGTYNQHLYAIGVFDSGLGLYARKSALERIGARIPGKATDAWQIDEFNQILAKLAVQDEDRAVLDLKLNYRGEWYTYGFSPIVQSAGADLINRNDYQHSSGVLNSAPAIGAMQQVQDWIQQGWVDPNLDDAAFINGRVALSWVGHWEYARYKAQWQDDLLILPLPDFGTGSKTGQGSWSWAVTRNTAHVDAALRFLQFMLQTKQVLAMSDANGAVPGTRSAVQQSKHYGQSGDLHLFAEQLMQGVSVPRPKTPAYPVITTVFQQAFLQIRNGADPGQTLDAAAVKIDQDIRDNKGYPLLNH
jgi:multiple sugar transport system substrate-binding protein